MHATLSMETSMQKTMEEENPSISKSLIATSDQILQSNMPLSYFMSLSTHQADQPKTRMKIPKLLAKTMERKSNHQCKDTASMNNGKSAKPRKLLPKKVSSILRNVFGTKKSHGNGTFGGFREEIGENENGVDLIDQNVVSRSNSLKESLEFENEKSSKKPTWRTSLNIFKAKKMKKSGNNYDGGGSGNGVGVDNGGTNGKHGGTSDLSRISCKRPSSNVKIMRKTSTRKKITKNEKEEEYENGRKEEEMKREKEELCKKRILMGGKCRPLNLSGALHYDKDGILLPEFLSSD